MNYKQVQTFAHWLFRFVLYGTYTEGTNGEADACHNHHVILMTAYKREDYTTKQGSDDLWYADGTIEQSEISAHVLVAFQSVGNQCERH